ncbi:MAG: type IV pilus assembly protein PilM [Thermoguttaceae bacterium]
MAKSGAVWGIDIGRCALKALRCRAGSSDERIEAEVFDYIEYPKILSQPDANREELLNDAFKQFLSRNSVRGDSVAISVSGQEGLARFIKLPPMEAKKIPNIVKYEAKQQIPFDLNEVIWDYQRLGLGTEEEGFVLETEIGLFAMKRDAVYRAIEPFRLSGIEVDYIQLTPLALYNFLLFDRLRNLPAPKEYDPENPPESMVILSLGTDTTDLVITNGYRVWQRSIPLGGNHFTKALTREMKLTFAKAEHLKRNATAAADPKAVFQAMRPVFNDLLTQIQRSISYFSNLDRAAKIGRIVALGNAMKLPGLRRFLMQSLGYEIERVESFHSLTGSQVLSSPIFKENAICFGACYGLALQALGKSAIRTNLLPREIIRDRMIKQKKPWAVAAVASLLIACGVGFGAYSMSLSAVDKDLWRSSINQAKQLTTQANSLRSDADSAISKFNATDQIGQHLVGNVEGRIRWLELMKAINTCLPHDSKDQEGLKNTQNISDPQQLIDKLINSKVLHIENLECQYCDDVSSWFSKVAQSYQGPDVAAGAAGDSSASGEAAPAPALPAQRTEFVAPAATTDTQGAAESNFKGPSGPGWIVKLEGYHYHNSKQRGEIIGAQYLRDTLINNLLNARVELPDVDGKIVPVTMEDLGITYPVIVDQKGPQDEPFSNPYASDSDSADPLRSRYSGRSDSSTLSIPCFRFTVHFCWQPKSPSMRRAAEEEAIKAKQAGAQEPTFQQ